MKQSSLDDQDSMGMELDASMSSDNGDDLNELSEYDERRPAHEVSEQMYRNNIDNNYRPTSPPTPTSMIAPRGLPWKPKVRQKDIDSFLDTARMKFLGYSLPGDRTTLFGLPEPIHEGVRTLEDVSTKMLLISQYFCYCCRCVLLSYKRYLKMTNSILI